ncbi:hypothetical protein LINPERPRIM_LOCUS40577 [Linum perenne]
MSSITINAIMSSFSHAILKYYAFHISPIIWFDDLSSILDSIKMDVNQIADLGDGMEGFGKK